MNNSVWIKPKDGIAYWNRRISLQNSKLFLDMAQNTRDWIEIDKEFKAKKPKF